MLDSDLKDTVDTWNRKNRRIGSCLGQNLYILLVFSQRIPYVVYLFVLISVLYPLPFGKKMANQISKEIARLGQGGDNSFMLDISGYIQERAKDESMCAHSLLTAVESLRSTMATRAGLNISTVHY